MQHMLCRILSQLL